MSKRSIDLAHSGAPYKPEPQSARSAMFKSLLSTPGSACATADGGIGASTPQALNITADDADMFGVVTLSSGWLREKWPDLTKVGSLPVDFSSWDDGDALLDLFTRTRAVRRSIIEQGQDDARPDFGRGDH